jgi:hypothetical protein
MKNTNATVFKSSQGEPICFNCFILCGEKYETGYYNLDYHEFCGVQCFTEYYNKKELNVRPEKKSRPGPRNGRTKKSSRKNTRRSKSSK